MALGVEDFGIYNVVGGVVAMFSVISGSLSAAISRFITYELGKGDQSKLNKIFSASVTIQLLLSLIIVVLIESVGVWFLNVKMTNYAILVCTVAVIVRLTYGHYCKKHFAECTYHFHWDKDILMKMFGFAGWNFIGTAAGILHEINGKLIKYKTNDSNVKFKSETLKCPRCGTMVLIKISYGIYLVKSI